MCAATSVVDAVAGRVAAAALVASTDEAGVLPESDPQPASSAVASSRLKVMGVVFNDFMAKTPG
jgi:hypothetical protein